jgi:hypothetical protein
VLIGMDVAGLNSEVETDEEKGEIESSPHLDGLS